MTAVWRIAKCCKHTYKLTIKQIEFAMKSSVKASCSRAVVARLNTLAVFFIALGLAVTSTAQTVDGRNFGVDGFAALPGTPGTAHYLPGGTTGGAGGKVVYAKTFQQLTRVNQDGQKDLTTNITITSSMLTNQGNGTYTYNGSITYEKGGLLDDNFSEIIYTNFAPTADTRGNSTESTNELDVLYVSETVSAEGFSETQTLNLSINRYKGTVSEVVLTSPENTTDIDVIISFPQGLFHQNNDGSRSPRSVVVEIMYKQGDGEYVPFTENTELYIRDINGVKQPLSSSTTTVDGANMTVKSPADMNVADQLFFRPIGFTLPSAGKYTVRVRSADYADKTNYDIGYPRCAEIQFYVNGDVLDESILPSVNQIAFEATAYKGLSGTIKKFNYIGEARIPVWNGTDWNTISESENPAAIIRYLLTDSLANPRPISPDLIDNDSLVMLYNWCEQEGYKADGIVSEATKTMDVINEILKNCQGIKYINLITVFTISTIFHCSAQKSRIESSIVSHK